MTLTQIGRREYHPRPPLPPFHVASPWRFCSHLVLSRRIKNVNLSFQKQLKNDSKATGAGQTWSGFEKRPQYLSIKTAKQIMEIMFLLPDSCINMFFHYWISMRFRRVTYNEGGQYRRGIIKISTIQPISRCTSEICHLLNYDDCE